MISVISKKGLSPKKTQYLYLFIILLCFYPCAYAQQKLTLTPDYILEPQRDLILKHIDVFEDPSAQLNIDDIRSDQFSTQFTPLKERKKRIGFSTSVFWLRAQLNNQTPESIWYLSLWGSLSRQWEVYLYTADGNDSTQPRIVSGFRGLTYQLQLTNNTHYYLYLRARDIHAPFNFSVDLAATQQIFNTAMLELPLLIFAIGGLLTLSLYNLIYFLALREYSFLALSIFTFSITFELANHIGVLHYVDFFWRDLHYQGSLFAFLATLSGGSFLIGLLQTKIYLPKVHLIANGLLWFTVALTPFSIFIPYSLGIAASIDILLLVILVITLVILRYRFAQSQPLTQQLAQVFFILVLTPNLLRAAGIIDLPHVLVEFTIILLLVCLTLLSLVQTEKIRAEREQAERVAANNQAKDEFLTTMSHELRTPMNAVINAGHLLKVTTLSSKQRNYIEKLDISSHHMLELINDILDLARVDSQQLHLEAIPFQLDETLHQTQKLLSSQAQDKGLLFTINNHSTIHNKLDLIGDPTRLRQILLNLLGNAIKFTHVGKVKLDVYQIARTTDTVQLRFDVIDTGIGISPEQQQSLFKPFSQADSHTTRQYGGSGLGLAITHKLIERMGGKLYLRSVLKQGSHFSFKLNLPLRPHVAKTDAPQLSQINQATSYPHTLIVDDDALNRFFSQQLLENLGATVSVAESGMEALQQLKNHEKKVELILMDVSMPDMDGYETTQRIREQAQCQQLPIIALTAHAIAGEKERCLEAGMSDYLTKPFEVKRLKEKLLYWAQHQHTPSHIHNTPSSNT